MFCQWGVSEPLCTHDRPGGEDPRRPARLCCLGAEPPAETVAPPTSAAEAKDQPFPLQQVESEPASDSEWLLARQRLRERTEPAREAAEVVGDLAARRRSALAECGSAVSSLQAPSADLAQLAAGSVRPGLHAQPLPGPRSACNQRESEGAWPKTVWFSVSGH
eukprot:1544753-Rhodomonas_salina.2